MSRTYNVNFSTRTAGFALLVLLNGLLLACSPRAATKLDEVAIRKFVHAGASAATQRDAATLCNQLTEDAQIRLVEIRFSGSNIQTFDKPQWCELQRQTYAALPQGVALNTSVELDSLDIASDGKSAELSMTVVEEIGMGGRSARMSTHQGATVVLHEGLPRYSKLSARVYGGQ